MAKVNTAAAALTPEVADRIAAKQAGRRHDDEPPQHPEGALDQPGEAVGVADRTHGPGGREPK